MSMFNFDLGPSLQLPPLLEVFDRHAVDVIVIGGIAGIVHGSAYPTYDVDFLYARDGRNLDRMAAALVEIGVTLRGAPPDLPFQVDSRSLAAGSNFTFESKLGNFDILGHADGMRDYDIVRADAKVEDLWGMHFRVASIDDLIRMKRAAGRAKDRMMVEELIVIDELRRREAEEGGG
jgi:hypothetical protein